VVTAHVPVNGITFICNILIFVGFMALIGILVVQKCAERKMHRDLLEVLKIGKTLDGLEVVKKPLTAKEERGHVVWNKHPNANDKQSFSELHQTLDLPRILLNLAEIYADYEERKQAQERERTKLMAAVPDESDEESCVRKELEKVQIEDDDFIR
jgi:hypothetical protein